MTAWWWKVQDYLVEALCLECGRPVRCERYYFSAWVHIDRFSKVG